MSLSQRTGLSGLPKRKQWMNIGVMTAVGAGFIMHYYQKDLSPHEKSGIF